MQQKQEAPKNAHASDSDEEQPPPPMPRYTTKPRKLSLSKPKHSVSKNAPPPAAPPRPSKVAVAKSKLDAAAAKLHEHLVRTESLVNLSSICHHDAVLDLDSCWTALVACVHLVRPVSTGLELDCLTSKKCVHCCVLGHVLILPSVSLLVNVRVHYVLCI